MSTLTPMMAQYNKIKEQYSDAILMFRLGDFYEMFFEDAVTASRILQITLTSRNKGAHAKAAMCGVPYHAVDRYLSKLTQAGKKVAICDQVTEPNGQGIVEREVVRVVTPGTTFDDNILEGKANNYVGCVVAEKAGSGSGAMRFAFSYTDVTTGEFRVTEVSSEKDLVSEIERVNPAEIIGLENNLEILSTDPRGWVYFPFPYCKEPEKELKNYFQIKSLQVFGLDGHETGIKAAGMLFEYLKETQKTDLKHIQKINYYEISEFMALNESCIRNLELFYTNRGEKKMGTLISVLDQTQTSMGGRKLRNFLLHPLLKKDQIEARLEKVEVFVKDSSLLRNVQEKLKEIFDIERLLSRLSLGTGNARDLKAMQKSLEQVPGIKEIISGIDALAEIYEALDPLDELRELIDRAIVDEAPLTVREGGMIKQGYNSELDEFRSISGQGKKFLKDLQEREVARTGVNSLKVKFNKVFGYYIEISKTHLGSVPDDYIRKQTLVNAERFITPELKEYEEKVLTAEDRIKELEYALFYEVRMEVVKKIVELQNLARAIAELDVFVNFAFIAVKNNYCKPEISENLELDVRNGRHPVIEQMTLNRSFVPNDCEMNSVREFLLITGPNMGGKSTFLRQIALQVLMAQIGCYVPAQSAKIGLVDHIFTRVGASDNLAAGESTFMVEMQEAAYILNNASERSLIILDELGRGTSTYDGVSIAWALTEFVHDHVGARTLFATHYHELIDLALKLPRAQNLSALVRENQDEGVVFLYKIVEGGVDKSYGIEVAKLAGLPVEVISRARGVLDELETKHIKGKKENRDQMGLFVEEKREHREIKEKSGVADELKNINLNEMTPLEAMQKLSEMKKRSME